MLLQKRADAVQQSPEPSIPLGHIHAERSVPQASLQVERVATECVHCRMAFTSNLGQFQIQSEIHIFFF